MQDIPRDFTQSYKEPFGFKAALGQSAIAFAAGVLAGLGHVPFSLVFLSVPGFAAVYWLVRRAATPRGSMVLGYAAGAGYFCMTLFWIVEPFFVDPSRHAWMAPFALIFMAGGLALFWGLAARVARWMAGNEPTGLAFGTAWVVSLTLAEVVRSYLFTGFPWALPAYIWTETAVAQLAAVVGPHGLTFVTLALSTALTGLAFPGLAAKIAGAIGVAGPVALVFGLAAVTPPPQSPTGPMLRLVQPNAPQHQKWHPDMVPVFFQRGLDLTAAPGDTRPDLVIWPETSAPRLLNNAGDTLARIAEAAQGAEVIVGGIRRNDAGLFNSLVVLTPQGYILDRYDKHHLVPFGEYVPLVPTIAALGWKDFAQSLGSGYTPGDGVRALSASVGGPFQPLICYEVIFPHQVGTTDERPNWLLQITNDAWFGNVAGPYQHLAQARMRAIEQGLPLVRVANTGVSAVVDSRGHVLASLPLNTQGYLDVRLPRPLISTPYSVLRDWPLLGLLLLCALATLSQRRRIKD